MSARKKYTFRKFTNGNEYRDYIYVKDVAKFIYDSIRYKIKNLTINLVTGKSYKINNIILLIKKNLNKKLYIEHKKKSKKEKQYNLYFDNKLINKKLPNFQFSKLSEFNFRKEFY